MSKTHASVGLRKQRSSSRTLLRRTDQARPEIPFEEIFKAANSRELRQSKAVRPGAGRAISAAARQDGSPRQRPACGSRRRGGPAPTAAPSSGRRQSRAARGGGPQAPLAAARGEPPPAPEADRDGRRRQSIYPRPPPPPARESVRDTKAASFFSFPGPKGKGHRRESCHFADGRV